MADLTLTPGSRRKLLRHIDEGLHIGDLARKMDISLIAVRKIILADDELKDACLCNGTLSPEGIFTLGKPIEVPIPSGMNPDFVKKVWAKRRKEAEKEAANEESIEPEPVVETALLRADELAQAAYKEFLETDEVSASLIKERIPVKALIRAVCFGTDVTFNEIISHNRSFRILKVRDKAICLMALARPDMSLPSMALQLGGRDHSTLCHTLKKHGIRRRPSFGRREITREDMRSILALRAQGMGFRRIADTTGVSRNKVEEVIAANQSQLSRAA
ncbi:hypothetical protein F9K98_13430 [Brucella anthropi]|uniref:helix-turn-helix domain-containing protein n=1 Tax=Brucella anthropi TaxID=529 RepID=UPI00124F66D8|nr:helix-turn-helix domain-containing protein [Brucella anthropi]KAB2762787.1 hypothetical protein F9K98_13430 [Brucella anthropi]